MIELITNNPHWLLFLKAELIYATLYATFVTFSIIHHTYSHEPIYPGDVLVIVRGLENTTNLLTELKDNLELMIADAGGNPLTAMQLDAVNRMAIKARELNDVVVGLNTQIDFALIWDMYADNLRHHSEGINNLMIFIENHITLLTS